MNSSVADIDAFIRSQKQKLSQDRITPNQQQPQRFYDNNQQYMPQNYDNYNNNNNLNNNFTNGYYSQSPQQQQQSEFMQAQISPRLAAKQLHPSPSLYVPLNEQAPVQAHRITKTYKEEENTDGGASFFEKFGTYEKKKQKLKQDLHNEYNQYKQAKGGNNQNRRNPEQSSEYYATLPLGNHDSAKRRAKNARNSEYNYVKERLDQSEKASKVDWWKDHNAPDVKPYSKHASIENLSQVGRTNRGGQLTPDNRSQSQYDVIADRRFQLANDSVGKRDLENRPPIFDSVDQYRVSSANSGIRQKSSYYNDRPPLPPPTMDNYRIPSSYSADIRDGDRAKIEMMDRLDGKINFDMRNLRDPNLTSPSLAALNTGTVDPYLADILRRPPVGTSYSPIPVGSAGRVQFNDNVRYEEPPRALPPDQYRRNPEPAYNQQPPPQQYQQNRQPLQTKTNHHQSDVFNFNSEDNAKALKNQKMKEYQEELERQVNEKRLKKQKEKEDVDRADRKFEAESKFYDPFGRGGGGAPIKDRDGNVAADLSKLRFDYNELQNAPIEVQRQYKTEQLQQQQSKPSQKFISNAFPPSTNLDTNRSNKNEDGGTGFARGGNGIFGEGKTEAQKIREEKYASELQRQIEEKKEREKMEKEKIRQEEEREMKRFEETQKRLKAELEEEERKKRAKQSESQAAVDNAPKRKQPPKGRKPEPRSSENTEDPIRISPPPRPPVVDFNRTKSPPIPALRKKNQNNSQENSELNDEPPVPAPIPASADYFTTESRLNNSSPKPNGGGVRRTPSPNGGNNNFSVPEPLPAKTPRQPVDPKLTARISKPNNNNVNNSNYNTRPPSVTSRTSSSEVIQQLQNLKKHLHNEQQQLENELNNGGGKTNVGQMVDMHQKILSVRTPPGSSGGAGKNTTKFDTFYNAAMHNEPVRVKREPTDLLYGNRIIGGNEPKTYFRENSVLLQHPKLYSDDDVYLTDLERHANDRQYNKFSIGRDRETYITNPTRDEYDMTLLTTRNEQRLRKLRDLEGDNLSLADPNDVLNKFMNRNNRRPSVTTLQDDTWMRQPA